jgi:hypothetical protein
MVLTNIDGMVEDARFVKNRKKAKTLEVVIKEDMELTQQQVMLLDSITENDCN